VVMGYGARMPLQELALNSGFFWGDCSCMFLVLLPIASAEKSPVLTCRILAVTPLTVTYKRREKPRLSTRKDLR
jgi:hypothetical protein